MYEVDRGDTVRTLADFPQCSVGAPNPFVVSDGHRTILTFYVEKRQPESDGTTIRVVGPTSAEEPIAIVSFTGCHAHMFGPPNDEAFQGHPLASRGLEPYGAFEVDNSSWVRRLERMNSVHPYHRPELFTKLRHVILTFHDETFECVCDAFDVTLGTGSMQSALPDILRRLEWGA